MKTYIPRKEDVQRRWLIVDARQKTLGRLATSIARLLMGKDKPQYTPFFDLGDYVIVTNARHVKVTGSKLEKKLYFHYSGYPGGLKSRTLRQVLISRPERVIREAVRLMLPKNTLGRQMIKKLKVYAEDEHPHAAQSPQPLE